MTRVILHIGTEKTGTTSIQQCLSMNRKVLLKKGIVYPHIGPRSDAHFDLVNALHPLDNGGRYMEFLKPVDTPQDFYWNKLADCIKQNAEKTIVLSAEHFSSRLRENALTYMKQFFQSLDVHLEIVIYLRPQADFIESSYSTEIKAGSPKVFAKVMQEYQSQAMRYDYFKLVSLWERFFGREAINVIPYEKSVIGADIRRSFLNIIGVDNIEALDLSQPQLNLKWSKPMLEFARLTNMHLKDLKGQRKHQFLETAERLIDETLQPLQDRLMTEEQYNEVCKFYDHSNQELCQAYCPERTHLFCDVPKKNFRQSLQTPFLTQPDFIRLMYASFLKAEQ